MKHIIAVLLLLAVSLPVLPAAVSAQDLAFSSQGRRGGSGGTWAPIPRPRRSWEYERSGVYLGGGLLAHFIAHTENDLSRYLETGKGVDAFLGIRFSEYFALEFGTIFSVHATDPQLESEFDTALMHALTVDGKFFLIPNSLRLEPFLQFGGGGYMVQENGYQVTALSGGGFHAGGGVDLRINPVLTLGARGIYRGLWMHKGDHMDLVGTGPGAYLNHITLEAHVQAHF